MTNMSGNKSYDTLESAVNFAFDQRMKNIYTCMPGIIVSYNSSNRTASVRGALDVLRTDSNESIQRKVIGRVPVIFPSGGGYQWEFPLNAGDPVLLLYSQRGLDKWKGNGYKQSRPDPEFFSEKNAICIPAFGAGSGQATSPIYLYANGTKIMKISPGGDLTVLGSFNYNVPSIT